MPLLHLLLRRSDSVVTGGPTKRKLELSGVLARQRLRLKSYSIVIRDVSVDGTTGARTVLSTTPVATPFHSCYYLDLSCLSDKDVTSSKSTDLGRDMRRNGLIPLLINPNSVNTVQNVDWSFTLSRPIHQSQEAELLVKDINGDYVPFTYYRNPLTDAIIQATARVHLVCEYDIQDRI